VLTSVAIMFVDRDVSLEISVVFMWLNGRLSELKHLRLQLAVTIVFVLDQSKSKLAEGFYEKLLTFNTAEATTFTSWPIEEGSPQ
jgi:hypothetical protein